MKTIQRLYSNIKLFKAFGIVIFTFLLSTNLHAQNSGKEKARIAPVKQPTTRAAQKTVINPAKRMSSPPRRDPIIQPKPTPITPVQQPRQINSVKPVQNPRQETVSPASVPKTIKPQQQLEDPKQESTIPKPVTVQPTNISPTPVDAGHPKVKIPNGLNPKEPEVQPISNTKPISPVKNEPRHANITPPPNAVRPPIKVEPAPSNIVRPVYDPHNPGWRYSHLPGRRSHVDHLPSGYRNIYFNNFNYGYYNGVFYQPYNNGYIIVSAPLGMYIDLLPFGYSEFYLDTYPYFYYNGNYFDYRNDHYYVVSPPVGALVESLPKGYETITIDGETYYEIDGAEYKPVVVENGEIWFEVIKSN